MEDKSTDEKMDKKRPAPTLPVSVEKKQQQQARAAPPFLHIDVQLVNLWTFSNAVAVTICFGVAVACDYTRAAAKLTDAEGTLACALVIGMVWCSTPQAAAEALALLLPCHCWRLRRATAYAALALTVASHCMYAGVVLVVIRADPEGLFFTIVGTAGIFICAPPWGMGKLVSSASKLLGLDQLGVWDLLGVHLSTYWISTDE